MPPPALMQRVWIPSLFAPEMYGALPSVVDEVHQALAAGDNLVGMGCAPEGIEQNPVVYELMNEMSWSAGIGSSADLQVRWWRVQMMPRQCARREMVEGRCKRLSARPHLFHGGSICRVRGLRLL